MAPRKRSAPRDDDGVDTDSRQNSPPPKAKKPSVASNAQAIASLSHKMSGVDSQLATMNTLLTQMVSATSQQASPVHPVNQYSENVTAAPAGPPLTTAAAQLDIASQLPALANNMAFGPAATGLTSQAPLQGTTALSAASTALDPRLAPGVYGTTAYTQSPRTRHHTAGPALAQPTAAALPFSTWPVQQSSAPTPGTPLNPAIQTQQSHAYPWDHPTTVQDMAADTLLTRRVAEALQAVATPFVAGQGKDAQFPHLFVTRGPKKSKTNMGEPSMPEFLWGFIQIVKGKGNASPDVPYMMAHLEQLTEDAKSYDWKCVRAWSEEVLSKVAKGQLVWSDTYRIDRLQTELSHKTPLTNSTVASPSVKKGDVYEMAEDIRSAKPGPPCKFYQSATCSHSNDHVQNGYRQLQVCSFCLTNKCQFQPHSLKDCKSKKFEKPKKGDSGFGN